MNWVKRIALLRTRLGIASRVTSIFFVLGRALILRTIFLAGVAFTAQFYSPLPSQVEKLRRIMTTFLWEGRTSSAQNKTRRPVASPVLELSRSNGGIGLVHIERELDLIAAKRFFHRGTCAHGKHQLMVEVVMTRMVGDRRSAYGELAVGDPVYLTPRLPVHRSRRHGKKLWDRGRQVMEHYLHEELRCADLHTLLPQTLLSALYTHCHVVWTASGAGTSSITNKYRDDWKELQARWYTRVPWELRCFWGEMVIVGNRLLRNETGDSLRPRLHAKDDLRVDQCAQHTPVTSRTYQFTTSPPCHWSKAHTEYIVKLLFIQHPGLDSQHPLSDPQAPVVVAAQPFLQV